MDQSPHKRWLDAWDGPWQHTDLPVAWSLDCIQHLTGQLHVKFNIWPRVIGLCENRTVGYDPTSDLGNMPSQESFVFPRRFHVVASHNTSDQRIHKRLPIFADPNERVRRHDCSITWRCMSFSAHWKSQWYHCHAFRIFFPGRRRRGHGANPR